MILPIESRKVYAILNYSREKCKEQMLMQVVFIMAKSVL